VRGVTVAWLGALAIISYRTIRDDKMPPVPGRLLGASGAFALLALLAEYGPAAPFAVTVAFGLDLAALLAPGVIPASFGGTRTADSAAAPQGSPQPAGG
jgi:hypothetical protein